MCVCYLKLNCQKYKYTTFVLMQTFSTNGTSTGSQNDEFALIITHSPLENDESLKNARVGFHLEQLCVCVEVTQSVCLSMSYVNLTNGLRDILCQQVLRSIVPIFP